MEKGGIGVEAEGSGKAKEQKEGANKRGMKIFKSKVKVGEGRNRGRK